MRNTKIALAVLALVASTAAMAEGATISGTIDAGIANTSGTELATGTEVGTYFSGAGGFVAGNNINFIASEDLDGGMKATVTLGMGFDAGNGLPANGGSALGFTQQANVALAGDFGTVKLGHQLSPFIASVAGTGMLGNGHFFVNRLLSIGGGSEFAGTNGGSAGPGHLSGGFFVPSAVSYTTPSMGGFSATVLATPKIGSNGGVNASTALDTNSYTAYSLTGSFGDVGVSATLHNRADTYRAWATSANYKMGPATVAANYMVTSYDALLSTTTMANVDVKSWGLGAGYDVSEKLNVALQYAKNDITGGNQALTGAHAKYSLSKRTFTYVSYTHATNGAASAYEGRANASNALGVDGLLNNGNPMTSNRTIAVGVAHNF